MIHSDDNPNVADVDLGNEFKLEPGQDLVLIDKNDTVTLRLDAATGDIRLLTNGTPWFVVQRRQRSLRIGGGEEDGDALFFPKNGDINLDQDASIRLDGGGAALLVGTRNIPGKLLVRGGRYEIQYDGGAGTIRIIDSDGGEKFFVKGEGILEVGNITLDGKRAKISVGGNEENGEIHVGPANNPVHRLIANRGELIIGNNKISGKIDIRSEHAPGSVFFVNGDSGNASFGMDGLGSDVFIKNNKGTDSIIFSGKRAVASVGGNGENGHLFILNKDGKQAVHLSGESGNVYAGGDVRLAVGFSDCAEDFPLQEKCSKVVPGEVMVISESGELLPCSEDYASNVAGVIAGACGLRPGIILGHDPSRKNVARLSLVGRVFCAVDANREAIKSGDLLTSSSTPGHAMKASDISRRPGTILGKALGYLDKGCGQILILVCLQ